MDFMEFMVECYDRSKLPTKHRELGQELVSLRKKVLGATHRDTLRIRAELETPPKLTNEERRIRSDADVLAKEAALAEARKKFGDEHPKTLEAMSALATAYYRVPPPRSGPKWSYEGRRIQAIDLQEQLVALCGKVFGPTHQNTLGAIQSLGDYNWKTSGRADQAREIWDGLADLQIQVYGPESVQAARGMQRKADHIASQGDKARALALREEALQILTNAKGADDRETANSRSSIGSTLVFSGRARRGLEMMTEAGPNMRDDTYLNHYLAGLQLWFGQVAEYNLTRRWMIDWASVNAARLPAHRSDMLERIVRLSCLHPFEDPEQKESVRALLRRADAMRTLLKEDVPSNLPRGMAQFRFGEFVEAEATMKIVARTWQPNWDERDRPDHEEAANYYVAMSLFRQGRGEDARKLLAETDAKSGPLPPDENPLQSENPSPEKTILIRLLAQREAHDLILGGTDAALAPSE